MIIDVAGSAFLAERNDKKAIKGRWQIAEPRCLFSQFCIRSDVKRAWNGVGR